MSVWVGVGVVGLRAGASGGNFVQIMRMKGAMNETERRKRRPVVYEVKPNECSAFSGEELPEGGRRDGGKRRTRS